MTDFALLFADVVESTAIVERLGDSRASDIWVDHDRRARALLTRCGGREIDRTDGFFLLFANIVDSAHFAVEYHRILESLGLKARVGLHFGSVRLIANVPEDIARGAKPIGVEGVEKSFAARVMALAGGGQTLLSAAARRALGDKVPQGSQLESHGHYRLKGIEKPVEIFELGMRDLAPFSPPADVEKAYRVVRIGDFWRPTRDVRHNVPAERDAFVGRSIELWKLAQRLDAGARLITVQGSAGAGKTRFVRRYAWTWLGDWPGGVYFCDLSEARSLEGILFAIASTLDVQLGKEDPVVQLGHAIAGRGRCLVILDNFEQVRAHAPATVGHWLDRAADAAFLVTSREKLNLVGEETFLIEPLPIANEAIDLFVARARSQWSGFELGDANRAAVATIVRLLDGLPLAIELAASRIRVLSPTQLVERLKDRFRVLSGVRGAAARQATLRAAIDWSWDLLTPCEQAAFSQCAVFEGGFTLEAAEAVLDLSAWPTAAPTVDVVQALVDKSLLRSWVPPSVSRYDIDEPYFAMYASIHEYAQERLRAESRGTAAAEERHGDYFAHFGSQEAIEALSSQGGIGLRRTLVLGIDNIVIASRRAITRGNADIAARTYLAAWQILELQGPVALATSLGRQVLAVDGMDARTRAAVLDTFAMASLRCGRVDEAALMFQQALAIARDIGDRAREGRLLAHLGTLPRDQGAVHKAQENLEAALAIHRETGDRLGQGIALGNLGNLLFEQGQLKSAQAHYEAALEIHREAGNRRVEGSVLGNLALVSLEQGQPDKAIRQFETALAIQREVGSRRFEGTTLGNLAMLLRQLGRLEEARENYQAALAIHRAVGNRRDEGIVLGNLGMLDVQQDRTDDALEHYESALAIAREVGYRRAEGAFLSALADLFIKLGRDNEARLALCTGERILRAVGDRLALGKLLCVRGRVDHAEGKAGLALAALIEAETVATETVAGSDSELGREIAKLRQIVHRSPN
jgi:predicted ATPase/class 3 adenylate cyclase